MTLPLDICAEDRSRDDDRPRGHRYHRPSRRGRELDQLPAQSRARELHTHQLLGRPRRLCRDRGREARPAQPVRAGVQGVSRPADQLQGLERPQRARCDDASASSARSCRVASACSCCAATTTPAACTSPRPCARTSEDLSRAVGWSADNLVITRFGLNEDFIDRARPRRGSTIWKRRAANSSTMSSTPTTTRPMCRTTSASSACGSARPTPWWSSPKSAAHLCRDAILEHIPADAVERYQRKLTRVRNQLRQAMRERVPS